MFMVPFNSLGSWAEWEGEGELCVSIHLSASDYGYNVTTRGLLLLPQARTSLVIMARLP